jgi:hypothetical protein
MEQKINVDSLQSTLESVTKDEALVVFEKTINPLTKLILAAYAFNKQDGFVPNLLDPKQEKFTPWITYSQKSQSYVCNDAVRVSGGTKMGFNLFFFKTGERAVQFGQQFIDLWDNVLNPSFYV